MQHRHQRPITSLRTCLGASSVVLGVLGVLGALGALVACGDNNARRVDAPPTDASPVASTCPDPAERSIECPAQASFAHSRAHWLAADTIAWPDDAGTSYELHYADCGIAVTGDEVTGSAGFLSLSVDSDGLSQPLRDAHPHLADYRALRLDAGDVASVPDMLRGQTILVERDADGAILTATRVQIPGVLDDLYTYDGALGAITESGDTSFHLWAPTARWVCVHVFDATTRQAIASADMTRGDDGVWRVTEPAGTSWYGNYYKYEVYTYSHDEHDYPDADERMVTDPYSLALSTDGQYSMIVDLDDPATKPEGWDALVKPTLEAPEDIVIYEAHIRDFSVTDTTVPAEHRGRYLAFTHDGRDGADLSDGMRHLQALAQAGLTHLHLLPAFDIASVGEDASQWIGLESTFGQLCAANANVPATDCTTHAGETIAAVLASLDPSGGEVQRMVGYMRDIDGFNWGYDPFHYSAPEGSYATDADGLARIVEFRAMVQALASNGLRVVLDVVYNHTTASGRADKSVLDRIVPGYYHRLHQDTGAVERSTCCDNTASEHAMMEKLMIDSLIVWARHYKVDAFRFDLMGHHMKANMLAAQERLAALTTEDDGVDGAAIYLYGEGWNFGEVENNQRGVQATQLEMAGTGIGTFSDRLRDAVRGGGPFDSEGALRQNQGFISGNYYDPNERNSGAPGELDGLLYQTDLIRVGMAGNLRSFSMIDRQDRTVRGSEVCYGSSPGGYTDDPQEVITYVGKHDNQTLWDISQYKLPTGMDMDTRVRVHNLGNSIVLLGQGIPFLHMGQDMLRSKSMERDSYNSGDWFNRVDFTYQSNNWNVGLPRQDQNGANWSIIGPIIADPSIAPVRSHIERAAEHVREILAVRASSRLFRLGTGAEVSSRVMFLNTGSSQIPGLVAMSITDGACAGPDLDPALDALMVFINANDQPQTFTVPGATAFALHPALAASTDPVVRTASFDGATGTFSIPGRTTAVFVQAQGAAQGPGLACNQLDAAGTFPCDAPPPPMGDAYVRGTMNDWMAPPEARMTEDAGNPGVYSVDLPLAAGGYMFKIADDMWGAINLGIDGGVVVVDGPPQVLTYNAGDISLTIDTTGTYRFVLDARDMNQQTVEVRTAP